MNTAHVKPEFKWWDALLAILGTLMILGAWFGGLATNLLNGFLVVYVPIALLTRVWWGFKGQLETRFIRRPLAPEYRWFLVQA